MLFWKDESIIKGGLIALALMSTLFIYVIIMLIIFSPHDPSKLILTVSALIGFPNAMSAYFIISVICRMRSYGSIKSEWLFLLLSIPCGIFSLLLVLLTTDQKKMATFQVTILLIQSLIFSYILGMLRAFKDVERKYPPVKIITNEKETITGLSFYQSTDFDYRFFNEEGKECIIPNQHIKSIEYE